MADASREPKVAQRAPNVITGLVVTGLPLINGKPPKKTLMTVEMGEQRIKTTDFVAASQSPDWKTNILVNDLTSMTSIRFSLYARGLFGKKTLLAATEIAIDKFSPSDKELSVSFLVAPSQKPSTLVIRYETNLEKVASDLLASSSVPSEGLNPSKPAAPNDVTDGIVQVASESAFDFLDSIQPFKEMFDRLAQVHPMASAAWSLLTLGLDIMEAQYAKDKGIVSLREAMIHTFEIANEKDVVREWKILQSTFDAMIRQTIECQIFVSGYISKNYLRRLIKLDISKKTAEFRQGFVDLEAQFSGKLNRGVAVVTIGTHEAVKFMEQDMILGKLNPYSQLRPGEQCLLGTRIEPIAYIISWIAKMNGEVMFLTGFPGTGKSTLMSSIADAARRMCAHSRLGAYFRFDSKLMNDASNVIATIAYRLASFDKRVAETISIAVKENPDFEVMTIQEQFKNLLLDPLQAIEELEEEGPIVVLIDALDECEASEARTELFKVLASGFGATLPFIRLIVASRALPDITNAFNSQKKAHIHTYSLDNMAKATEHDIRLYFTERFRQLENDTFDELCAERNAIDELTKRACGLFIYAFTTYTFIKQYPSPRLLVILETVGPTEPEAALDAIYQIALSAALAGPGSNSDIKADMRTILGAILVVENPPGLVSSAIDGLLFHSSLPKSQDILRKLACVIIAENSQYALRSIHTSFDDFLMDKKRSGDDWHIDIGQHNKRIATFCIRALGTHFERIESNTLTLTSSATIDAIILGNAHSYACKFWIVHLCKLDPKEKDLDSHLRIFFQKHFLRWLQSMSKLNLSEMILPLMHRFLQHTNKGSCSAADRRLRYDAFQFAEQFIADIKEDPTSIFSTGLTFCADNSSIRTLYPRPRASPNVEGTGYNRLLALSTHKNTVHSAVFFPDGSKFVSASWDLTLRIWDGHTGAPISDAMKGHTNKVVFVRVSPDGSRIVSGGYDNMVIIWDAHTGQQLMEPLRGHDKPVITVDFSPDSSRIVSAGEDKCIRIWSALTGLPIMEPILGHDEGIDCVVFSPDGKKILSGADDYTIRMWDAFTGAPLFEPIRLNQTVMYVAFSPNGSKFVSGSADNIVRIWDSEKGTSILEPIQGHDNIVSSVSFSNDGTKIVSGSWDRTVRIWDSATGDLLTEPMQGHTSIILSVQFSPDNTKVLSASGDSTIRIWEVATDQPIATRAAPFNDISHLWNLATSRLLRSSANQHIISGVAFSRSGANFISGDWDNSIKVWDTATSSLILGPILGHTAVVFTVAYSPSEDLELIASGSQDATIRLWDANTGKPFSDPLRGHDAAVITVSFSSDSSRIVSSSCDHTIRVWDVATGRELFEAIRGHKGVVNAAFFSPDDTTIASGSDDNTVGIWDASMGESLHDPLRAHTGPVTYVAWSPNGEMIASASQDGSVKLWDFETCEVLREFQVHGVGHFGCVTFWPDGQKFLAVSADGMVRAWNTSTSVPLFEPIRAHTGIVSCAALSPDASKILTGSFDKTLRLWDATNGAPLSAPIEIHNLITSFCCNTEFMALGAADNSIHVWNTSTMTMLYDPLTRHKGTVLSLSLDSEESRLVSGSKDRTFIVWNIVKGERLYQVEAHADMLTSVTFSPDGSKIATGSADKTIKLWNASNGASIFEASMTGHDNRIVSVAFSSDSLHLVSASLDHTIRVWETSTGASNFVTESIDDPLENVVFSVDGQSLIYASTGGVIYRWPFRATLLASSSSSSDDTKKIPLSQSKILVKFPRGTDIIATHMTSKRFTAAIHATNQLITVDLP
ncbi:hypothetical protein D9619_006212 [Psilocybe cf. subviscida]|uniref:NACHT domain-containing protein n=1 Tax=Psilocybe cf. subviscida TaxID=2480587 RepID=A0A8H5B4A6_9AGAR|nr:hypothetical protein D9619_006212 [Psilocybe cf. subviscida]